MTSIANSNSSVDVLADQALAHAYQHLQQEKQRQEEQTNQQDQQAIAVLQTLLSTEIEVDLLSALSLSYEVRRDAYSSPGHAEALFFYAGVDWHLSQDFPNRSPESWRWSIRATTHRDRYTSHISDLSTYAAPQALRTTLLVKLGERRQQLQNQERDALAKEQTQLQEKREAAATKEREEHERAERIAQANQEHARWKEQIAALKQQELERLWRWPANTSIALYRLTYTTGIGRGEEDESLFEQEHGWTAVDHLDSEGYIRLEPVDTYWTTSQPREIKLDLSTHQPIWERIIIASVNELPKELREEIRVSIPNVYSQSDADLLDDTSRLTYIESERYFENDPYSEYVGLRPLPWIRALVDQAAEKASTS